MSKHRIRMVGLVVAILAIAAGVAYAAGFIYFAGPIGDQGTFPVLGGTKAAYHSDADRVLTQSEYAGGQITAYNVASSLSVPRAFLLPSVAGEAKDVFNATTGGQAILVGALGPDGGVYGATVSIANGTGARVQTPDGINYYGVSGGSSLPSGAGVLLSDGGLAYFLSPTADGGFLRSNGAAWSGSYVQSTDLFGLSPTLGGVTLNTLLFATGNTPGCGRTTDAFGSDANRVAPNTVYSACVISLSGTQTYRTYFLPLNTGATVGPEWIISNGTTSPLNFQGTFDAAGGSGLGDWCATGAICIVRNNGTNVTIVAQAHGNAWTLDDFDAGGVQQTLEPIETCGPVGNTTVCSIAIGGATIDNSTWVTLGQIKPAVSTGTLVDVAFFALDRGQDAGGVPGNLAKCNLEFIVSATAAGVINMTAAAGSAGPSTVSIPLACISSTDVNSADGGPDAGSASQANSFTFQALNTSGVAAFQVKGPDSHLWTVGGAIQRSVQQ